MNVARKMKNEFMRDVTRSCLAVLFILHSAFCAFGAPARTTKMKPTGPLKWDLKFTEDFKGDRLNPKLWARIPDPEQGVKCPDWLKHMSLRDDLIAVKDGQLHLYGVRNDDRSSDSRPVLCGGVTTKGLFNMRYGKIEVKVRLEANKGAWPAIWLMPQTSSYTWPMCGEIDVIERLNSDPFVYQTVHSGWTAKNKSKPPSSGKGKIKPDEWNVFGMEWTPTKITWLVNGSVTHSYPKVSDEQERWPWTVPFYLMIDMQLGGTWVGSIDESTLPVAMHVDWVKFYQLSQGGKRISDFTRPK